MTSRSKLVGAATMVAALAVPVGVAVAATAAGGGESAGPAVLTIELVAHHSRFTPALVAVDPGETVQFVVRNLDPIDHELIVGGPEVHRRHEVGRDAHHHGEVPGEVSVPAGGTASTTWTAPPEGSTAFSCHLPGHLAYGMSGLVITRS